MRRNISSVFVLFALLIDSACGLIARADYPPFEDQIQALLRSTDSPEQAARGFVNAPQSPGVLAIPRLLDLSESNDEFVRLCALCALHELGADDQAIERQQINELKLDEAWLETAKSWKDCAEVSRFVRSPDRGQRNLGLTAAFHIWKADPHVPPSLDESVRENLRAGFSDGVEDLNSVGRTHALQFLSAIGPRSPKSVRLVLTCLGDGDAQVRALAAKVADGLFTTGKDDSQFVDAALSVLREHRHEPAIWAVAIPFVERMGPQGKSVAAELSAIDQLATAYRQRQTYLENRGEGRVTQGPKVTLPGPYRKEADAINLALETSTQAAHEQIIALLMSDPEELRKAIAGVIAKDQARFDRHAILLGVVRRGTVLSNELLKILQIDPAIFSPLVMPVLKSGQTEAVLAAVNTLKQVGVEGDEIREALASLLNSPNDDLLYGAAELLGRQDILNRKIIPNLLADLRSDSPNRRSIAARQFDELRLEPEILTKALIRAVDRRDMPARMGLIKAIEGAYEVRADALETLKKLADQGENAAARSFARAALRELDLTRAQNEVKP